MRGDDIDGFWVKSSVARRSSLPGCLSSKVKESRVRGTTQAVPSEVHYIWLYVTRDGVVESRETSNRSVLLLNDWLNIVDESASLGAQWMVIHVETCLKSDSDIWRICAWAQEVYGIRVGLHLNNECMDEKGLSPILRLDRDATFVIIDRSAIKAMSFLKDKGYAVCESNIGPEDRELPCSHTESIVCACADGVLFCCGMVVGDESYHLGDVKADTVHKAMCNHESISPIEERTVKPGQSCDGCPPFMVQRFKEQQAID